LWLPSSCRLGGGSLFCLRLDFRHNAAASPVRAAIGFGRSTGFPSHCFYLRRPSALSLNSLLFGRRFDSRVFQKLIPNLADIIFRVITVSKIRSGGCRRGFFFAAVATNV